MSDAITDADPADVSDHWDDPPVDELGVGDDSDLDLDEAGRRRANPHLVESSLALFDGDDGGLELAQRRALVVLLKKRFVSAQTDPKEWKALIANPGAIRSRLHDLFLDLHLDTEYEVAFKRQVHSEAGGQPFPTLLYDAAWGREDTIVLVYLRTRFRNETAAGAERVFVDVDDITEYVAAFRPSSATDRSGDARRTQKAIETIFKAGLLIGSATGNRFQVSNAIEPLLTLETLKALQAWLREENGTGQDTDPGPTTGAADKGEGARPVPGAMRQENAMSEEEALR